MRNPYAIFNNTETQYFIPHTLLLQENSAVTAHSCMQIETFTGEYMSKLVALILALCN